MMRFSKLERRPELDALRGLFLVWMTLTHLPTRVNELLNEPVGFVSSAEGFIGLSAFLVGRIYFRKFAENESYAWLKLWKRSLKIYQYHLMLLALAFTVAAGFAVQAHRLALTNLLHFYLGHPGTAIIASILLIYCPPLLDILPMYVAFLFFTPLILAAAARMGWRVVLAVSLLVWLGAQLGLRDIAHQWIVHVTHLQIPLQETGAFNLFGWQLVWVAGLWLGATSAMKRMPLNRIPGWMIGVSAALCLFFVGVRYGWLGPHLTQQALGMTLDKWQVGPLRALNIAAFIVFLWWLRKYVTLAVAREPFLTLGKASLQVFCAHLFFVFFGLALLYGDITELHGVVALSLLVATMAALIIVAAREVHKHPRGPGSRGDSSPPAAKSEYQPSSSQSFAAHPNPQEDSVKNQECAA